MASSPSGSSADALLEELVSLERSALDRWVTLDPQGYLGLYADEVTYFDPTTETRLSGLEAMKTRFAPMKDLKLPFTDPRYEMLEPKVQRHGDVALLTFNLVNYGKLADQPERVLARWNSSELYARVDGKWRIIHSHWSYVRPEIKQPNS
jgi:ketosteroid isomerase-like protein